MTSLNNHFLINVYIDQEMIIQAGHSGFNIDYVKNIIDGLL
tara:strand:- start:190 stop:312 length:123 start_codon:yes stop_codon:yes gene_type:complete